MTTQALISISYLAIISVGAFSSYEEVEHRHSSYTASAVHCAVNGKCWMPLDSHGYKPNYS